MLLNCGMPEKTWESLGQQDLGLFSSGGPSVRFLTRYDGEVSEPLVGRQGSRVSMRVAREFSPVSTMEPLDLQVLGNEAGQGGRSPRASPVAGAG